MQFINTAPNNLAGPPFGAKVQSVNASYGQAPVPANTVVDMNAQTPISDIWSVTLSMSCTNGGSFLSGFAYVLTNPAVPALNTSGNTNVLCAIAFSLAAGVAFSQTVTVPVYGVSGGTVDLYLATTGGAFASFVMEATVLYSINPVF